MVVTVLCRPDLDKYLAAQVSLWLRDHVKRDDQGYTDVEFFIFGDHTDEAD